MSLELYIRTIDAIILIWNKMSYFFNRPGDFVHARIKNGELVV